MHYKCFYSRWFSFITQWLVSPLFVYVLFSLYFSKWPSNQLCTNANPFLHFYYVNGISDSVIESHQIKEKKIYFYEWRKNILWFLRTNQWTNNKRSWLDAHYTTPILWWKWHSPIFEFDPFCEAAAAFETQRANKYKIKSRTLFQNARAND